MARLERRAEMREIRKNLLALKSDKILTALMKDKEFGDTVQKNLGVLARGEHSDTALQMKYLKVINYIQTVNQLEERLRVLRGEKI